MELDVFVRQLGAGQTWWGSKQGRVQGESRQSGKERAVITSGNERQLRVSRCCRLTLMRRRV